MNITPDSGTVFETGETKWSSVTYLDATHFVIAYRDQTDSAKGKVVCGSISGFTPTLGTIVEFDVASADYISISRLDSTHFVIAYQADSDGDQGKCRVGSVSGTTITLGTVATFESNSAAYISVCGMDATHFVVAYYDLDVDTGKVRGASVSGTTITRGASDQFESSTYKAFHISVCSLSSTHFVIAYRRELLSDNGLVICGTLSGNTVSIASGTGTTFGTGKPNGNSITALSSTHFAIAFADGADSNRGKVIVGSVSGTTITISADSATVFEAGSVETSGTISIAAISQCQFLISFIDIGDSGKGKAIQGSVSGVSITMDDVAIFENGNCGGGTYSIGCAILLDGDYFAIAFTDRDDSNKGKVIIGRYSAIREGEAAISSTSSMAVAGARIRDCIVAISSVSSLSLLGNFFTLGNVDISVVSSLTPFGGTIKQGDVSISSKSNLIAVWRIRGICSIQAVPSLSAAAQFLAAGEMSIAVVPSVTLDGMRRAGGISAISVVASMVADGCRTRYGEVIITAVSSAEMLGVAYVAQIMGYTGTLAAGDVLIIDADEQTVTLNGSNATQYFTGDFPQLYSGTNELLWQDGGEVPDLDFETKHSPRYL